ncbi:DUF4244 domain-containing protein [Nocardioides malaquae]|nr:DUF4244 domain-containing protein [Nocardioides malaquae]
MNSATGGVTRTSGGSARWRVLEPRPVHNPAALHSARLASAPTPSAPRGWSLGRTRGRGHRRYRMKTMTTVVRRAGQRRKGEEGITTAEYAVGTAAGAGFAALLFALLTGGLGDRLLNTLFDHVLSLLGVG